MASVTGGQYQQYLFTAPSQDLNLVTTPDGKNLPPPTVNTFNLELVISPKNTPTTSPLYDGGAYFKSGDVQALHLLNGDFQVVDDSTQGGGNDAIFAGSGNQTIIGAPGDTITGGNGAGELDGSAGSIVITPGKNGTYTIIGGADATITGRRGGRRIRGSG